MPSILSRTVAATKRLPRWIGSQNRAATIGVGVGVLALVGISVGFAVAPSSKPPAAKKPPHISTTTSTTAPKVVTARCPLTDTPPAGGVVPDRPALLVKVGNEPNGARPQSGLNEADIVFDTPAEGFVMRYVAVYQCNNASSIGPTRSLRWVDWMMIARQFVNPIVAYAGGINPNVDGLEATPWIDSADLLAGAAGAAWRIDTREAPDNLYTSTSSLYALYKSNKTPPPPIFDFSAALPPGSTPAASVGIDFSYGTDVVWKWDAKTGVWLHTYLGTPDIDVLSNTQVQTTNVVIQIASYQLGPYSEHGVGEGDVESELLGSGPGYVLRGGRAVKVTWHREDLLAKTTFTNAAGQPVDLAPGRTWVEIDPDTQADAPGGITITP